MIVMILSFVYSGISLIAFIIFFITFLNDGNLFLLEDVAPGYGGPTFMKWISGFFSIITGLGTVITFLSGLIMLRSQVKSITNEVNHKAKEIEAKVEEKAEEKVKNEVDADVLLPDEKKVIEILERHERSMTQKELVSESGLSKVKVHRVLKGLERKKVVSKYAFGMTNRIRLEKSLKT